VATITAKAYGTIGNSITLTETGTNIAATGATLASGAEPTSNAFGILATAINMAAGQAMSVPVYRAGHFNVLALTFDSSFDLEEEKIKAFQYSASKSPTILISRPRHQDSHIDI
jgi:predicted regulator of Ras-like GTPase activity (Roadblock/LC7/MglB family)